MSRFRKYLWIGCIGGLLLVALIVLMPRLEWIGAAARKLVVSVQDAESGRPVVGATVEVAAQYEVTGSRPQSQPVRRTDDSGRLEVMHVFPAGGCDIGPWRRGTMSLRGCDLVVKAPGYEPFVKPLSQYFGETRSVRARRLPPITVQLPRLSPATGTAPSN